MKQTIMKQTLAQSIKVNIRQLRVKSVAYSIAEIFHKGRYIGQEKAISQRDLFYEIFGKFQNPEALADELRWEYARRAMHYLRQRTHCFIASALVDKERQYFVVKTADDAQIYIDMLNNTIQRMRSMQRKAMESVEKEWWKEVLNGRALHNEKKGYIDEPKR